MNIVSRISELMDSQGKKQFELADYLGISRTRVNYWFLNSRDIPAKYLLDICKFLEVSPQFFFTGEEDENKPDATEKKPAMSEDENKPSVADEKPAMSEDESELLRIFNGLDREGRTMVLATAYNQRARMLSKGGGTPSATA